ncbi:ABC transporter substrate-binding protein [Caldicellulosiruptoraceae bacterium PP1]
MKLKRIISFICLLTFVISIFSFNSLTKGNKVIAASKAPITLTFYNGNTTDKPHSDLFGTKIGKEITKLTGVKLKINYLVGEDEATKVSIMIASGDLPDLIYGHQEHGKFIEAGLLVPIEDYIQKYGVNTKKTYSALDLKRLKQSDGHIYFLSPQRSEPSVSNPANAGFWLPLDALKENKWPKIRYWDDYLTFIRNYVKKHPTIDGAKTIGFTFITESWRFFTLENPPSYLMGYQNDGDVIVDPKTYEAKQFFTSAGAKRYYRDLNKLWNEGLIDKDAFVQGYDQYIAKIAQGRVVGFYDQGWQWFYNAGMSLIQNKKENKLLVAFPVTYKGVAKSKYNVLQPIGARDGISISKKCKNPVAAFKFLDALLSNEAQMLMYWGIKGEDYLLDKNGKPYRTAEMKKKHKDDEYCKKQGYGYWWLFPHAEVKLPNGIYRGPGNDPDDAYDDYTPIEKEALKAYNIKCFNDLLDKTTVSPYGFAWDINVPADRTDVTLANQKMHDVTRKYLPKLVMAKPNEFDKIWNEYVKAFSKTNYTVYEKFKTEQIKWRMKAWN